MAFCRRLLLEQRVGLAPGICLRRRRGGAVRICYAADSRILEAALSRLEAFLASGAR